MPWPSAVYRSTGLTPAARTRTRTSVGKGWGRGSSVTASTSGPPKRVTLIARMVSVIGGIVTDVSTHELSVRDGVVVKRFRSWARGEPAREWTILRLLDEHARGLGPAPVRADLDGDPPSVTMSLVPGVPLAAAPTAQQLDALAAALCRLWTVPVAGLPPRRYLPDEVAATVTRDLAGRRFGESTVDTAIAAAVDFVATPWVEAPDPVLGH